MSNTTQEFGTLNKFGIIIPAVFPLPGGATTNVESGCVARINFGLVLSMSKHPSTSPVL